MIRTLVIVRHGNTFAPGVPPRRIGARTDLPLVESGREQGERLGRWFADHAWRFDRILCSPLQRASETAQAIQGHQRSAPPVEPSELLMEVDHGPDENASDEKVVARIGPEALAAWDTAGIAPPGWHVDRDARLAGWRGLFAEGTDERTLLVTSNGAARFALLAHDDLMKQATCFRSLKLRTGAFGVIEVNGATPRLVRWDERP